MPRMLRLIGLAVSIGLADSINPTTIAPGLYLASGEAPRRRVLEFTLAVFVVSLIAGVIIALGPGQLLLSAVPHPRRRTRDTLEVVIGALLLVASAFLWLRRDKLSHREPPKFEAEGRSSAILGAMITAIELPTAFPYFAVIAAVVGSGAGAVRQIMLLVIFNLCFIAPLLAILGVLTFARDRATSLLGSARDKLQRNWPRVLSVLLFVAGVFVVLLGVTGLTTRRSRIGRILRHFPPFRKQ
jgi:cytochrome c biogenesis protein CcdA